MAEAVVDRPISRFFCHKCSIEIERLLPDYTCPRCSSGFIEELESDSSDSSSAMHTTGDIDDLLETSLRPDLEMDFSNPFETSINPNRDNGPAGNRRYRPCSRHTNNSRGRQDMGPTDDIDDPLETTLRPDLEMDFSIPFETQINPNRNNAPTGNRRYRPCSRHTNNSRGRQDMGPISVENFIQDFLLNLSEGVAQAAQLPVFNIRLFLGNPGDYVWGQDGLDAIVTQLLNQMDGTGPPPLPRKQIDEIPTITVGELHVDSKLQCSVCWEDFKLSEPVKQLPCLHLYHAPCIVPWLELHGTCPICRQHLGDQNTEAHQDSVGRSLVALFRADYGRTSSTSSSSEFNSSSNSSSEI